MIWFVHKTSWSISEVLDVFNVTFKQYLLMFLLCGKCYAAHKRSGMLCYKDKEVPENGVPWCYRDKKTYFTKMAYRGTGEFIL